LGGCLVLFLVTGSAFAQTGTVSGSVTQSGTGLPVEGAQVRLDGTSHTGITQANGRYLLVNVPAGTYTVLAEMIGHQTTRKQLVVTAGQTTTENLVLTLSPISMQEIVVTGVSGATPKAKLPFSVDRVGVSDLPVPQLSAASALQGKVAGVMVSQGSGRPGELPDILLRGPTNISGGQSPLYVVDGVVLSAGMSDFDALNIENIEVIKGAAAASMYGSRAANGVVHITTKRGRNLDSGEIRYSVRSEYGRSQLPGRFDLAAHHAFAMNEDGTKFLTNSGAECDWLNCPNVGLAGQKRGSGAATEWNTYMTQKWPGTTYDQVDRFFTGGAFMSNYVSAAGRVGNTNFHVSFNNQNNEGVMPGLVGHVRNNFNLNLDQNVNERITLSASAFYSRSRQDPFTESQGTPMFNLTRMPAGVDLLACNDDPTKSCADDTRNIILKPDPFNENENPLNVMLNQKNASWRGRFLGSSTLTFAATNWLDLSGNFSYDRYDSRSRSFVPKGYRDMRDGQTLVNGQIAVGQGTTEGINASASATARKRFGDLSTRFQVRYLYEQEDVNSASASGWSFYVPGVPTISNTPSANRTGSNGKSRTLADGFFLSSYFDLMDRYILDVMVRQDGSSRFGADQRRAWYYRVGGAYRLTEEEWFNVSSINELKLHYALGTAGSAPDLTAQYETYSVGASGVSPGRLGNRDLRPAYSTEQEMGVDLTAFDRLGLTLTYATTTTRDQILSVPLRAYEGFTAQVRNAGTLKSDTWEASLSAQLVQTQDLQWSARLIWDHTKATITELDRLPFKGGVSGQAMDGIFYFRPGEVYGTYYGRKFATDCSDLHPDIASRCSEFSKNDDGYLVWAPASGKWGDDAPFVSGGALVKWGAPLVGFTVDRTSGLLTDDQALGKGMPDFTMGLSSTLTWKNVTLYGLVESVQGFEIWNQPLQWSVFQRYAGIADQTGIPEDQQKPLGYYSALYNALAPNSAFVQDGSFTKLREVQLSYRFTRNQLAAIPGIGNFSGINLSLIGRNLFTWSSYNGYDPETGRSGGTTGSSAIARVDGYNYPNFRTWTMAVELNF
jgi:TonB-linked SusC/RagA family outer membrane protein